MNEFEDLFSTNKIEPKPVNLPPAEDYDPSELFREQKINGILIGIYFGVQILLTALMMFMYSAEFPNPNELYANLVTVETPAFTIELDETDLEYPYLVHITGLVQNLNEREIPMMIVSIDFYYQDELLDTIDITREHVAPSGYMAIDEYYYFSSEIDTISYGYSFDFDTAFTVLLNFSQALVLGLGFLFIDRSNFKRRWKEFKANKSNAIGKIVLGAAMVYGAMIISQLILDFLGAADTSQNEMTIASMFTNDPLRLVVLFLLLCVFTPIVEEVIYRKVIFGWLDRKFGAPAAIIISGAIFGLMHVISYGDFIQSIPYIFMGGIFGFVYHWSRNNIYVTIGVHFINNFLAFALYALAVLGVGII
ncbi:MAG: hypothetical protein CVV56_00080 [Tenericutes bacterium HGW-Tenericutes-1]|jgi:hypothetical protein|nr:MAG: hypothetical protein CVV56_00080 [Tenericutes bacterium HGW-Tenericutes-1]